MVIFSDKWSQMQGIMDPEIRAACIQFLFSAVYHLKSIVIPYSSNLLKLSLKFIGKGSEQVFIPGFAHFHIIKYCL